MLVAVPFVAVGEHAHNTATVTAAAIQIGRVATLCRVATLRRMTVRGPLDIASSGPMMLRHRHRAAAGDRRAGEPLPSSAPSAVCAST
jgi:hypothetical protein